MVDFTKSSQVAEFLRNKGFNIIPIAPGTKIPPKGFKLSDYFDKKCDFPITDDMSIALLHGKISNTFAIDIDMKNGEGWKDAIAVLVKDKEKMLAKTMVVKSPKQGVHLIFAPSGDLPPKNVKYFKGEDIEIDIKTQGGYTLLPPSGHPDVNEKYEFISDVFDPNPTDWSGLESLIKKEGFSLTKKLPSPTYDDSDGTIEYSKYDMVELLAGGFTRGSRRKSLNSLYCKMRVKGSTQHEAEAKIREINRKLTEPLDEDEINTNCTGAELYFTGVVEPKLEKEIPLITKQNRDKKPKKKNSHYMMASQIMEKYEFISDISGEIYYCGNGVYRTHGEDVIRTLSRRYWESIGIETKEINEIVNIIKDKKRKFNEEGDIFDTEYTKIILTNVMVDIETGEFGDHDPQVLSLTKHPIYFDADATCPKFEKYLDSCFGGDERRITHVLEMMALCFIKKTIIQKGFVNYGIGKNGKTTLMNILTSMLGMFNVASRPMQDFQGNQFIGYELRGKNAVISGDAGTEPLSKTGMIKALLGGDYIRCEQKNKNPFLFLPYCTLIFTFNELPPVNDASDGFARKIQTIHWDKKFYGKDMDRSVDNLQYDSAEKSGIFNKLLPIMSRLLKDKKLTDESTVEETKEVWLSRSDSFFRFKKEKIVMGVKHRVEVDKVKEKYEKFCEENGMTALRERALFTKISQMLNGAKPLKTRVEGEDTRFWVGFTLDSELRDENQKEL